MGKAWWLEQEWQMAGHGQVQEETPGLYSKPGFCSPAPGAQRCPLFHHRPSKISRHWAAEKQ